MWQQKAKERFERLKKKYHYNEDLASEKIEFIETYCHHIEGDLAGQLFKLEEWQKDFVIRPIFGLLKDGKRLIREAYIQMPRKNGKTTLVSPIQLLLLLTDGEAGAQIINAAGDDGQANLLYRITRQMAEMSGIPELKIYQSRIVFRDRYIQRLTSKASTKHGMNLHGAIIDEKHVLPNRDLYDVLRTSMGQRSQPLMLSITTPGTDRNSICYQTYDRARNVLDSRIEDDQFWGVIYEAPQGADIHDPKVWAEANPLYDTSPHLQKYIARESERAREDVSYENTFRQLHLGQWTQTTVRYIKDEIITRQMQEIKIEDYAGTPCVMGLDLASYMDCLAITVRIIVESGKQVKINYYWIPEEKANYYEKKFNIPYKKWSADKWINVVPGNITDFQNDVEPKIMEIHNLCPIMSLGYDPSYGADQVMLRMQNEYGLEVNKHRQGFGLHPGFDKVKALFIEGDLITDKNPVSRWMYDNAEAKSGSDQRIMIVKAADEKKVDGVISDAMAEMEILSKDLEKLSKDGGIEVW